MLRPAALLLLVSGFASLTYQVTWARLLGLSIGASSAAVSTVVAVFFLGLSAGSYWLGRSPRILTDPLRSYAMLEAIIGASGLVLLPVLLNLDRVVAVSQTLGESLAFKFAVCALLLLLPTACMGATFPLMARAMVRRASEIGVRLSDLYAFNTFGAVLGALGSGFVLIPRFGLDGAIGVAATLNFVTAALALLIRRRAAGLESVPEAKTQAEQPPARHALARRALMVLVLTGFVSIAVEVAWTKYLVMVVGTTIYGFAAILGSVLFGVALGSWSVRLSIDRIQHPERWLALGLCALGLCLLLTRSGLTQITELDRLLGPGATVWSGHLIRSLGALVIVLPATFLFGALFPLALRLAAGDPAEVGPEVGKAYAANTLAGILGSVVAGFYWLPEWGTPHLLLWTAILTLLGSALFIRELPRRWALGLPGSLALATIVIVWLPAPSYAELVARVRLDLSAAGKPQPTVFLKEGHTGVVSADEIGPHLYKLYNNGLNESRIDSKDGYNALLMESLLGLVPYLVHERPRSAFVVGLGGGATMRALEMSAIERLRVVELEARVREALETLLPPPVSGLGDPRLELSIGDARNALLVEDRRYDIIVSQPSHPWRAGAANLFTREFFEIARSRLAPGGVYGQWLALFHMDPDTLRSIMGSFVSVFPHAFALSDTSSGDILFFGSTAPLVFVEQRLEARTREFHIRRLLKRRSVSDPVQLLSLFTFSRAEMLKASEGAPLSTDTNLLPEVRLGPVLSDPNARRAFDAELKSASHFDILPYLEPRVRAEWLSRIVPALYARGDQRRARQALAALATLDAAAARKLQPRRRPAN